MDYKDSQAYQDSLNAKKYSKIAIAAWIVLHAISFAVSKARFVEIKQHLWYGIFPILALASVAFTIIEVMKDAELTELNPWPYRGSLLLMWFSCWALFYCSTC